MKIILEKVTWGKRKIVNYLKQVTFFRNCSEEALEGLAEQCHCARISSGEYIYRREQRFPYLVIICEGSAFVYIGFQGTEELLVKIRRTGDYIGEMGVLGSRPQPCNVAAQEDTEILLIPEKVFLKFMEKNSQVVIFMFRELISRIDMSSRKLINTIYMDADGKLAYSLTRLMVNGKRCKDGTCVTVSQNNLALASGLSRQTVVRIMTKWKKNGWIRTERKKVIILNETAIMDTVIFSEMK